MSRPWPGPLQIFTAIPPMCSSPPNHGAMPTILVLLVDAALLTRVEPMFTGLPLLIVALPILPGAHFNPDAECPPAPSSRHSRLLPRWCCSGDVSGFSRSLSGWFCSGSTSAFRRSFSGAWVQPAVSHGIRPSPAWSNCLGQIFFFVYGGVGASLVQPLACGSSNQRCGTHRCQWLLETSMDHWISCHFTADLGTRAPDSLMVLSDWVVFLRVVDLSDCSGLIDCIIVSAWLDDSGLSRE